MAGGVRDWLARWRHRDQAQNADYPSAESRRPHGLPFKRVELGGTVTLDDLADGGEWPPPRLQDRAKRMRIQHDAAHGQYSELVDTDSMDVLLSPIGDYEDTVTALLLASGPTAGEPGLDMMIQDAVEQAAIDMIRHGRALLLGGPEQGVRCIDIRYCWPTDEGAWLVVSPRITVESDDGHPDVVDVWVWAEGQIAGVTREWEQGSGGTGRIGPVIGDLPGEPTGLAVADHSPITVGWGTPLSDRLIPLAVAMARRESGLDYAIDRHERPVVQFEQSALDLDGIYRSPGSKGTVGIEQARQLAPALRQHDVLIVSDGMTPGEYLTWDSSMAASFQFLDYLGRAWTRATGFAPIEPGDSGQVPSGIAVARRNAMGVARVRRLHSTLLDALHQLGLPVEWEYIDSMLAGQGEADPMSPPADTILM